jgi:hypothetical protein
MPDEKDATIAALENENMAILAVNEKLVLEIEKLSTQMPARNQHNTMGNLREFLFKHGEDTYGFNFANASYKGKQITPVEVCADEEIQKHLVEKKSGMIFKISNLK